VFVAVACLADAAQSQAQPGAEPQTGEQAEADAGIALPDSLKLRFTVDFLAGYGSDATNAMLGFTRPKPHRLRDLCGAGKSGYPVIVFDLGQSHQ